jgi:hypothetical protein
MAADKRLQCHWMHPVIARLEAERAAYERAGRPPAVVTAADIEAEWTEIARRIEKLR